MGPTPAELESLNELIKFDHIYYKTDQVKTEVTADSSEDSDDVQIVFVTDKSGNLIQDTAASAVKSTAQYTPARAKNCKRLRPKVSTVKPVAPTCVPPKVTITNTPQSNTDATPDVSGQQNGLVTVGGSEQGLTVDIENLLDMITNDSPEHKEILSEIMSVVDSTETVTETAEPPAKKTKFEDNSIRIEEELGLPEEMFLPYSPLSSTSSAIDSGFGSDIGEAASPKSDISTQLGDNVWEESFTDLFPSLL